MNEVLVAVDLSEVTGAVIKEAKKLAGGRKLRIRLVHVAHPEPAFLGYDVGPQHVRDQVAESFRAQHRQLEDLAERLRGEGFEVEPRQLQGRVVEKILECAADHPPEWIVLGSHGRGGMFEAFVGSVCKSLLRHSKWPLLIVPIGAMTKSPHGSSPARL